MKEIIVSNTTAQTFRTTLENLSCEIRIYWVESQYLVKAMSEFEDDGHFYMDIKNNLFDIKGIRLVTDTDIIEPYAYANFGGIIVLDTKEERTNIKHGELGDRYGLFYAELSEIESVRQALRDL